MAYLGYSVAYMHSGHVQLCDMLVRNPLVTPIQNGTTYVSMVFFRRMGACLFEGYC